MRLLCEIFVIGGLIYLGWERPFHDWLPSNVAEVSKSPRANARSVANSQSQPSVRTTPAPSGSWMWDPNHKTALDRPAYNKTQSFTGHITYVDENGHAYWLDASGTRHYEK
jgi:hypothetical protein